MRKKVRHAYENCGVWVSYRGKNSVSWEVGTVEVEDEYVKMQRANLETQLSYSNTGLSADLSIELHKVAHEWQLAGFQLHKAITGEEAKVVPITIDGRKARAVVTWDSTIDEDRLLWISHWSTFGLRLAREGIAERLGG